MKKAVHIFLFAILPFALFSQAPQKINYQGIARDASGVPITVPIDLNFIISDNANNNVHSETQSGIQPNMFGIFNTQIGLLSPISSTITWQTGPYTLSVSIKLSSAATFSPVGSQTLASVPYALYAERAGNSMPTATVNGSTIRWDQSLSSWKTDTNIINNGNRVKIGNRFMITNNKFTSVTLNGSDSAAVFGFHRAAGDGAVGVRGVAAGTSSASSVLNGTTGIAGGHFIGINILGQGIGSLNQGFSSTGNGIGAVVIGSSNSNTDYAVGLYATTDPTCTTQNRFAGVFENGNVFINDTLQLNIPGNLGAVLTRTTNGKAIWQSMPTSTATGNAWSLNGNAGTVAGTDFIGTSDASAFILKTNGIARIGINTSTSSISGGVVIGGNTGNTSLGRALTLQGLLSTSDASDQTYGHFAVRAGSSGNGAQSFISFANNLGSRSGFLGDFSVSDPDIYLNASSNLRLTVANFTNNPAIYIEGATNNIGAGTMFPSAKIDINNTSTAHALLATQNNSNEAAIINNTGNGTGIYGSTGATASATNPAIFGEAVGSSTNNAGVYGLSNNASGVKGFSQSSNGVWGESNSNIGVFGLSTGNGQAAKFLLQGTSSVNNAVYIATNSTPPALKAEAFNVGAAIEAKHSNSSAGSSNLSLLINDGHIGATGTNINSACFATTSAATTVTATKQTGSNDVRGEVIGFLSPTVSINPGQIVTISVSFDKQYAGGGLPYVLIEAMNSETAALSRYISGGSGSGFTVTFKNTGSAGISSSALHFKYFVIE